VRRRLQGVIERLGSYRFLEGWLRISGCRIFIGFSEHILQVIL
jgi:hypothetical protein